MGSQTRLSTQSQTLLRSGKGGPGEGVGNVCWVITEGSQIRAGFKDVVGREVGEAGEGRTSVEDRS